MKLVDAITAGQIDRQARQVLIRLADRWPTAAGIALALLTGLGIAGGADVAPVVTASGFIYLGAAALKRPAAAWPMFAVAFVVMTIGVLVGVDPSCGCSASQQAWWRTGRRGVRCIHPGVFRCSPQRWSYSLQLQLPR